MECSPEDKRCVCAFFHVVRMACLSRSAPALLLILDIAEEYECDGKCSAVCGPVFPIPLKSLHGTGEQIKSNSVFILCFSITLTKHLCDELL